MLDFIKFDAGPKQRKLPWTENGCDHGVTLTHSLSAVFCLFLLFVCLFLWGGVVVVVVGFFGAAAVPEDKPEPIYSTIETLLPNANAVVLPDGTLGPGKLLEL